jgi:hypothetical protein
VVHDDEVDNVGANAFARGDCCPDYQYQAAVGVIRILTNFLLFTSATFKQNPTTQAPGSASASGQQTANNDCQQWLGMSLKRNAST